MLSTDSGDEEEIINIADLSLYESKRKGGYAVSHHPPPTTHCILAMLNIV
jgi:hypothetical protein